MNLFYSKKTLDDTLVAPSSEKNLQLISHDDIDLFVNDKDEIVAFNIKKVSKKIKLPEGRLFVNDEIKNFIKKEIPNFVFKDNNDYFTVGQINECEPIDGTHLSKCKVDIGNEILDIVCGASNAKKGLKVVVAKVNTLMPSGLLIVPSKLKGFPSNGMLCSQKELNLEGFNSSGIIELDKTFKVGEVFKKIYANL